MWGTFVGIGATLVKGLLFGKSILFSALDMSCNVVKCFRHFTKRCL